MTDYMIVPFNGNNPEERIQAYNGVSVVKQTNLRFIYQSLLDVKRAIVNTQYGEDLQDEPAIGGYLEELDCNDIGGWIIECDKLNIIMNHKCGEFGEGGEGQYDVVIKSMIQNNSEGILTDYKGHELIAWIEGKVEFVKNGKRHREDGPAIISADSRHWYIDGVRHRIDGPAVEYANGIKEWWINGERHYTEEQWKQEVDKLQPKEVTMAELEQLLGYPVKIKK